MKLNCGLQINIVSNQKQIYRQIEIDRNKQIERDSIKTASKRAIQKIAEATGDLIGNKIADKIKSVSKKSTKELPNNDETKE